MADEMWRRTIGFFISADDINLLASVAVPRHCRATLQYVDFESAVPDAGIQLDAWWQAVALVPGIRTEASLQPLLAAANFAAFVDTLKPILIATKGWGDIGTPANTTFIDTMVSKHRDYGNLSEIRKRVMGIAINNNGPGSNAVRGWSLVYTSFDETLTVVGYLIMEILLEWPKNKTMVFKREHVSNEENQDDGAAA